MHATSRAGRLPGHPHACGENVFIRWWDRKGWRAIPARAGRTLIQWYSVRARVGPSPRVRGEPA